MLAPVAGDKDDVQPRGEGHYYRMALLSRVVKAFSPGYHAGTTIPELKVEPSVPGLKTETKGPPAEQTWPHPLVPVGNPNRD